LFAVFDRHNDQGADFLACAGQDYFIRQVETGLYLVFMDRVGQLARLPLQEALDQSRLRLQQSLLRAILFVDELIRGCITAQTLDVPLQGKTCLFCHYTYPAKAATK